MDPANVLAVNHPMPAAVSTIAKRHTRRVVSMFTIGLLATSSHAADGLHQAVQSESRTSTTLPLLSGLKEGMFWLRDFAFTVVAPMYSASGSKASDPIVLIPSSFEIKRDLFKPLSQGMYGDRLRDPFKPDGVKVHDNLLFQYTLLPTQSRNEGRDFNLKLGLRYTFR